MSITLPTPPPAESSEEARTQTLTLVLASALMMGALIGAMAYIYFRNRKDVFSPDENILDLMVGKLALVGFFGIIVACGFLMFTADDAEAAYSTLLEDYQGHDFAGPAPPDTIGDVGPSHYVQMVNASGGSTYAVWDKEGNLLLGPNLTDSIEAGYPFNDGAGDPIVIYDHLADRWLISEFLDPDTGDANDHHILVYISQTNDPSADTWYSYAFETPNFPDYPKITLWDNGSVSAYLIGTNESDNSVYALPRDDMLVGIGDGLVHTLAAGDFIRMTTTDRPNWNRNHIMPADLDGPAAPSGTAAPFVRQVDDEITNPGGADGTKDFIEVWELVPDFDTPASTTYVLAATIDIAEFDYNINNWNRNALPQGNSGFNVDALTHYIFWRLQYRNFGTHQTLVSNFTVDVGVDQAGIRWFELRNTGSGWSLYQEGTYSPDAGHRWMGSAAMDGDGNIALGFSYTDSVNYPSIRYTGRLAGDTLGTMPQGENTIITSDYFQNWTTRWGDYSAMSVDPVDDTTFWYTTEYIKAGIAFYPPSNPKAGQDAGGWRTRISAFSFEDENPSINAAGGDDNIILRRHAVDDTKIEILINGSVVETFMYDALDTLTIEGGSGNDSLTVDFDDGDPIPTGGLFYNGGTNGLGGDSLTIDNGSFTTTTYSFTNANNGTMILDGSTITYTGLEPITSTITATNVTLNYSTAAETITISSGGAGKTTVNSTAGESITFNNPSTSLTINAGNTGNDVINYTGVGSPFSASITVNAGTGSDTLDIDGTANPDTILMTQTTITVNGMAINYSGIETFDINTGLDDDTVVITGTPASTQTNVDMDYHVPEQIYIGVAAGSENTGTGSLTNIDGNIFITDYGNILEYIHIDNSSDSSDHTWTIDSPGADLGRVAVDGISGTITYDKWSPIAGGSDIRSRVYLYGGSGDDDFSVDFTGGNPDDPLPYYHLDLHGNGENFGDSLSLAGPAMTSMTYNYTNLNDGSVIFDDFSSNFKTINYFGLEPITSTINTTDVIMNYGSSSETITATDAGSGQTNVNSTAGETTTFNDPSNSLTINGGIGDDSLVIDFSSGNLIPSGGLFYNGGAHTSGDSLTLQGGSFTNETYTVTGPNSGTIDFDSSLITFTGLEPIYDTVTVTQLDIMLTSAGETVNVIDGPGIGILDTTEVNGSTLESIEFAKKTTATINGLDGADKFILNNPNSAAGLTTLKLFGNELTDGTLETDDGAADNMVLFATSSFVTMTYFYGQSGDDFLSNYLIGGPGHLDDVLGDLDVIGGPGDDLLHLQDFLSTAGPDLATLTSTSLTGVASGAITYSTVEGFFYEATPLGDTIDILSTNSGTTYIVGGDGDSDTFTIGNQSADFNTTFDGSLDAILGRITIWADFNITNGAADVLNIDDSGTAFLDGAPGAATISDIGSTDPLTVAGYDFLDSEATRLEGFAPAYIEYAHGDVGGGFASTMRLEYLNILGSTGDDTITVNDTTATIKTTVDAFTGDDSNTTTIKGDTLSAGNVFKGNAGNDRFVLNITSNLGASSVFPVTSLQIEGNAPASDSANRDVLEINDLGGGVRTLSFTYVTPVGGDVDITGFAVPINVRTMETIDYDGDAGNDDVLTVVGTTNIDSFFVTALGADYAEVYINGGVGTSAGPDLQLDGLHGTNGLTIDGDDPVFFTEPGDYLKYDGSGVLTFSGPGKGKIDGSGVLDVNFRDIEILDATGTFNVIINANSLAPGNMDDASADTFLVYRDGTGIYHRLKINGTLIYNIVFAVVSDLTINGSGDDDTMICDWGGGNPIPPNGIFFNGAGETTDDVIYLQNGTVINITYTFFNATDGLIEIDGLLITYTGLSPIYDNLDASNRIFNFPVTPDIIRIFRLSATVTRIESDSSSELVEFLSPTASMTVNMGAGDDVLTIGDDDPVLVPGLADDFTAALTINGDDGWDTINVRGPVGTPPPPEGTDQKLTSIAFNVQLANLYQPMYSDDITGTCVIVNVWFPALIQNALDIAHPTDGCLITVYPGTYPENLTNWKSNITLRSDAGAEDTIISASDGIILDLMTDTIGFTLGGAYGLGFTLLSTGTVSPDGVDKGLTGIDLVNLTITHNSFKGPIMDFGIHLTGVTTASPYSLIMSNTFYECGTAIAIFNGSGVSRLRITMNCIFDSITYGILLGESGSGDMTTVVITENSISNSGTGMKVEAGPHIKADFFVVKLNNFLGNAIGLQNDTVLLLTAKRNFWDATTGPYAEDNPNGVPNPTTGYGSGNPILDYVLAEPWLAVIHHPGPCDLSISLARGWNLVSITVELDSLGGDYTASVFAAEMNSQAGEDIVKYIVRWDKATAEFEEFVVDSDIGTDFPIEYGEAYYLYSISPFDTIFHVVGDCPVYETIDLVECWNLIGWKSMEAMDVGEWAAMIDHSFGFPVVQAIVKYNEDYDGSGNEYVAWYPGMDDDLFQLIPGEAYWIFVSTVVIEAPYP